jgi:hypothetical protein
MQCSNCNYENKPGAFFCTECGNPMMGDSSPGSRSDSAITFPLKSSDSSSSVSVKDSIIIGGNDRMDSDDMKEAAEGIELLRQLKAVKREDAAERQEIENRAKIVNAKTKVMEIEAKKDGGGKRNGELVGMDIAKALNEVRQLCADDEDVFTINMKLDILTKMVKDEQSIRQIETMSKRLITVYDDFSKLKAEDKKRIMNLCKYIEDTYCTDLIHGERKNNSGYGDDLKN